MPYMISSSLSLPRYLLTNERRQADDHGFSMPSTRISEAGHARIRRYILLLSPRYVMSVLIFLYIFNLLPPLVLTFMGMDKPQNNVSCIPAAFFGTAISWYAIQAFASCAVAVIIWKSRDAYYMKLEFAIVFFAWVVMLGLYVATMLSPLVIGYYLTGYFVISLPKMCEFVAGGPMVVYLHRRIVRRETVDADLKVLLKDRNFRSRFSAMLCQQFCIENLIFSDAVEHYREVPEEERAHQAQLIYGTFIASGSTYEVNISSKAIEAIQAAVTSGSITIDTFTEAQQEVLHTMKFNTLPTFLISERTLPVHPKGNNLVSLEITSTLDI
eukprot:TRINITY_DN7784_c0_g1_i2.p1 TRINITY_DN7784_c0_g1~~TRINITY_DN7784_c0_g1_i2.p1  ORF type:complete len:327 (+),score=54.37 TRINITY_DN7784_c0_g1_i2:386-1366(+)